MASAAPPVRRDEAVSINLQRWFKAFLFCATIIFVYGQVMADLATDWWNVPSQSQGLLIPPLALYIAWERRNQTLAQPVVPTSLGLIGVGLACFMFLVGKLGAEVFSMRASFVVLLIALTITFWGWRRLRTLALPFLLLATMVPLPAMLYNAAATPLQLLASRVATDVAQTIGVTVYRDGNIIHLANIRLGVEEACSGLNSLTALAVGAILLAYLQCRHISARVLLMLLSVPIAIAMNVLRVCGTAVIADYHREFALGFYHLFSGWLVFLLGFGVLYLTSRLLHRFMDPLFAKVGQ